MKKYFKIMSLVLSICLLSLNVGFNTYALENDTLYYQGVAIEQKELSEDTLEWLGWYNSLSPDEQDCINYEPLDLQKMIVNPEDITVSEPELGELDIDDIVPFTLGAPIYNPSWWNNSNRIKKANCYAYSMDLIQNFVGKLQPGQLSGRIYESLSESSIFSAVVRDGSRLGGGRYIRRSSSSERPGSGEYKVALVIAPHEDYHWYVLNTNGYWSHKRGHSKVTNVDASGKRITNPKNLQPKLWIFKLFSFLWLLHCKERIEIDNSILTREYIDRLILLKGKENISWNDFTKFTYKDIGSGGYVYEYPMKNNEYLYIIGYDLGISPQSIYIISEIKEKISIK